MVLTWWEKGIDHMDKNSENSVNLNALPENKVPEKEAQTTAQAAQPAPQPVAQAAFQPAPQPVFYQAQQPMTQVNTQPSKPKKTRGNAAKVVALALCCSLVGGAVGAGSVICLNAFGIGVRPGMKITRMINGGTGKRERRNKDNQERSANSDGNRDSFKNRGGNDGGQRKGTGRDKQYKDNVQPGGRDNFGRNRRSQGESNIKGKDQGTNLPDKGSDPKGQTTPEPEQTKPSAGGEEKT